MILSYSHGGASFPTALGRIHLNPGGPGDLGGGGGGGNEPIVSSQVPTPTPTPAPAPAENRAPITQSSGQADPGFSSQFRPQSDAPPASQTPTPTPTQAPVAGQTPAQEQVPADPNNTWQSIRDVATKLGYQFEPTVTDDYTALSHLITQARNTREADYYAQLGRQLAPKATEIQAYLQQQARPPEAPKARNPWEPPAIDQRWLHMVQRDEATGVILPKPGVQPEIAQKVTEYVEWQEQVRTNPAAMFQPMIQTEAKKLAEQVVEERFAQLEQKRSIQEIVNRNSEWFFARDAAGRTIPGPGNQPAMTPRGIAYVQHLDAVSRMGVTNPVQQDQLAMRLLQADELAAQQARAAQAQAAPNAAQAYQAPSVNQAQATAPAGGGANPGYTPPSQVGMSLRDMLAAEMARNGITTIDMSQGYGS